MLNSLDIKNYRNLKELTIPSLGRVNLITGKNNTGKSTLLEAIAIYATKGDLNVINQLLEDRGEATKAINERSENPMQTYVTMYSSLFTNRAIDFDAENAISIGCVQNTQDNVSLRFVKYIDEIHKDEQGNEIRKRRFLQDNSETTENYKIGFEIKARERFLVFSLAERLWRVPMKALNYSVQFVKTRNINTDTNGGLFDTIALTDKEQYVINALKIIEPLAERIAFIGEKQGKRNAVIKLSGSQNILPLQSMGDGINRILTIILALVNSDGGYLLIDEFENGLHYSVQEKLWTIVFQLSKELNIQVFATTHSEDCIRGFQSVLNNQENMSDGKLIRLDNENGVIKQVEFDAHELKIAATQDIEIR
ncbi:MAG: AAA family ATPase [Bacteroidales bacterium]|jgi:AAA15 family ATPase/GTPase|nr:AAA family ATPase [Bacteroidales bacterium]